MHGTEYSWAQNDSSVGQYDTLPRQTDSSVRIADSSETNRDAVETYLNSDSVYLPVKDSLFMGSYVLREVSQPKVNKYLADPAYEYANDPEYWKKDKTPENSDSFSFWNLLRNKTFQWIIFLTLIAVIIYGIFTLARENNFRWFSRSSKPSQPENSDPRDEAPEDYDESIQKYQAEGNYRFAIRYLFLRLIHAAAGKNVIRFQDSTTNSEIREALRQHPLASQFRYLANAYEYIYFGDFPVNKEVYDSLKLKFELFQEKITA
jgi:hypothetical protein